MTSVDKGNEALHDFVMLIAERLDDKERQVKELKQELDDLESLYIHSAFKPMNNQGSEASNDSKATNPKDVVGTKKAPMSTVSAPVMAEVGVAMLEGACKYGRHNYRAVGVRASVYYDATMRHLMSWWEGEDTDPDSGMNHVTKAITSLVVLRDAMIRDMVTDDRPPSSPDFYQKLNDIASEIIDRHRDKSPKHYTIEDSKLLSIAGSDERSV